jgi:TfoX/Sxy family transcriptional regulator of competence genes
MAYSEQLANRVRALLADRDDVDERHMFGGLTLMVQGHMCCGVHGDELTVRLDPTTKRRRSTFCTRGRWTSPPGRCAGS